MTKKTLLLHPVILLCLGGILASFEAAGQSEAVLPALPAAGTRSARDELIRNGDFEGRFTARGVAHGWGAFGEGVVCKPNPRLGRVGGGIYGTESVASGFGLYNSDYQTIRLHGKVNVVDASRFDLVSQLKERLAEETITIAKLGAESFFGSAQKALAPDAYRNGQRFADYCHEKSKKANCWARAYYGLDEGDVNDAAAMARIARFELGFTEKLHAYGLKSVVLNHASGTPADLDTMLLPEVRALLATADYVGYHSYGGPEGQLMCHPDSLEWYSLRWRKIRRMYDQRDWRAPPVIYTEGTSRDGWHDRIAPEAIRDDLIGFSQHMMQDDWTIGLAAFCTGNCQGQESGKWNLANYPGWKEGDEHLIVDAVRECNLAHPVDAHGGVQSQELVLGDKAARGGIVQVIRTHVGRRYRLGLRVRYEFDRIWPNPLEIRVGIDRSGQTDDPRRARWSAELIQENHWESDGWRRFDTAFTADRIQTSIWIQASKPAGGIAWVYIDDVSVQPES